MFKYRWIIPNPISRMLETVCHCAQALLAIPRNAESSSLPGVGSKAMPVKPLAIPKKSRLRKVILLINGNFFRLLNCRATITTIVKTITVIKRILKLVDACLANTYWPKILTSIERKSANKIDK